MGTKDNSNLDKIFKNEDNKKVITRRDRAILVKVIANMHDKLGGDRFNLVAETIMIAAKRKELKGENFTFEYLERVLKKAIEMVKEI